MIACRRALALLAAGLTVAGCASGEADPDETVNQRITRDFGHLVLASQERAELEGRRTLLSVLRAHERVGTSIGGTVIEIDGLLRRDHEPETSWARNVNGIEADESSDEYRLYPGDVVQWDYRYWYVTLDVRATVGAFPETFTRGVFGRRFPTTVECVGAPTQACDRVRSSLRRAGVAPDGTSPDSPLPPAGQPRRARILVGPWNRLRERPRPHRLDTGPRYSGVFARFSRDAETLRLLDWHTRVVRETGAGSGLIAAMRPTEEDLLWLVTGTDEAGVNRAARALNRDDLRDAFAVAVTSDGVQKLPLYPR